MTSSSGAPCKRSDRAIQKCTAISFASLAQPHGTYPALPSFSAGGEDGVERVYPLCLSLLASRLAGYVAPSGIDKGGRSGRL